MPKSRELAEEVFQPGNLVYGGYLDHFRSYLETGIRPPVATGKESFCTPSNICLAIMSKRPLLERYNSAYHYAPGGWMNSRDVGVIISRKDLMDVLPGQALAVGPFFLNREHAEERRKYDYNKQKGTVFGFSAVRHLPNEFPFNDPFNDEVRIYPVDPMTAAITPDRCSLLTHLGGGLG